MEKQDGKLIEYLGSISNGQYEFWSFKGKAHRELAHAYVKYPAMMVPQMLRELINTILAVDPDVKSIIDPFVGAGTTMTEAMLKGVDFTGVDINPLSVLICRAKAGPFWEKALGKKIENLLVRIEQDDKEHIEVNFPGLDKWVRGDVALELSRVRRAIQLEPSLWCRRFLWVAFAETVRLTSNSRTSTYKLHIRPREEIECREISVFETFKQIINSNFANFSEQKILLDQAGVLSRGVYKGELVIKLADTTQINQERSKIQEHDLLITSPPYGDNKSTIPYGQYSYLPLQWIDSQDIDSCMNSTWLQSTLEIDSRSLGGSLVNALSDVQVLAEKSRSFKDTMDILSDKPPDRAKRVAAFVRDLDNSLGPILSTVKPSAYLIWTVGNRSVGGNEIPTSEILVELLSSSGVQEVFRLGRNIPGGKRMAIRNSFTNTMSTETILIMRKAS